LALVERRLPEVWVGRPFADMGKDGRWRVVGLSRLGRALLPAPGLVGQEDDLLLLTVVGDAMTELDQALDTPTAGGH
jgi:hypothetical protein